MKQNIKSIMQNSFYQLLVVYSLLVLLISLSLFWKYTLHFEIFAVILAILGISIMGGDKPNIINTKKDNKLELRHDKLTTLQINKRFTGYQHLHYFLFALAILLIILMRVVPYLNNSIPIGYDSGIYKYGIENKITDWSKATFEPGFLYSTKFLHLIFSTQTILVWIFVLFNLLLGLSVYFVTKEYFGKTTGLIAFLLYAVSIIQFKVFAFMYYKNIIALSLALWALYFLKKDKRTWFIVFGALTGAFHRPTFYIFGLSYLLFAIISPIKPKSKNLDNSSYSYNFKCLVYNLINGILILVLVSVFYIGFFRQAILPLINPVLQSFVQTGESPGTFVSFFNYQFSTLAYLPFAILGFFALAKRKQFNMLFFWTLLCAVIVYFQFFFFNRFIIHLDIALIILASLGFSLVIENKKKFGIVLLCLMLFSAGFVCFKEAKQAKPIITQEQLDLIQKINTVEQDASVMSISSEYSPYILGWSQRKTIAPGLFEENKWTKEQWEQFWQANSTEDTKELMSLYEKPIYLFAGNKAFNNPCFELYEEKQDNKILKYTC